jgi:threonine aldolase
MHFLSDNTVGASAKVLAAINVANAGIEGSYGADSWTRRAEAALNALFECEVSAFLVPNGTAANALACAAIVPPWGALLTHQESHVMEDECGAPEFFMGGAKIIGLPGVGGKITPHALEAHFAAEPGGTRRPPLKGLSISQGTEFGLVYRPDEIAALSQTARAYGLKLHMDGARFWNALAATSAPAAALTWQSGVDVLSLGGTKNGCLMAEAVIFFDPALAEDFRFKRKRAGQTLSKQRLIGAQFAALLEEDHWRDCAAHANAMARRLAEGFEKLPGIRLGWPQQINQVFPILPMALHQRLTALGAQYYDWSGLSLPPEGALGPDEIIVRLVTSHATTAQEVEAFLHHAQG